MNKFWVKYKYRIVGAVGLATLYLVTLGLLWAISGGRGEGPAFILGILNFPFMVIAMLTGWHSNSVMVAILVYGFGGTLMYAAIGWLFGSVLRIFTNETASENNTLLSDKDTFTNEEHE